MKGILLSVVTLLLTFTGLQAQVNKSDSVAADSSGVVVSGQGKGAGTDTLNPLQEQQLIIDPAENQPGLKPGGRDPQSPLDTVKPKTLKKHNPKTAAWMSAALPGLGQIYNRKYWKLPIVYVGLGVCGYFAYTNTVKYRKYKETYLFRMGVDSLATDYFPNDTDNTVKEMKEYHHKNIEISYIAAGLIYLLNIIDATVDAHLYDFDISDDLSMRIEPMTQMYQPYSALGPGSGNGLKVTLKF